MYGKLFSVHVDHARYADDGNDLCGRPRRRTVDTARVLNAFTVCVRGIHVRYGMCVISTSMDVVDAHLADGIRGEPCDGTCKADAKPVDFKRSFLLEHRFHDDGEQAAWDEFSLEVREKFGCEAESHGRCVRSMLDDGGDSGMEILCMGTYHVVGSCMEFGSGSFYRVDSCPCRSYNPWCQPRKIRLPRGVESWVKAHPAETLTKPSWADVEDDVATETVIVTET